MPRDDYDDEPADRPPFPGTVRAAGIIWIAFGVLGIGTALAGLGIQGMQQREAEEAGRKAPPSPAGGACCEFLIPAAFLWVGYQTVRGVAKDTTGNAVGSLVFAFAFLVVSGAAVVLGDPRAGNADRPPPDELRVSAHFVVLVATFVVLALTLGVAGVLALMGRSQYRQWRASLRPAGRTERRRDGDRDEDQNRRQGDPD